MKISARRETLVSKRSFFEVLGTYFFQRRRDDLHWGCNCGHLMFIEKA
jgi:hypothetical protein